MKSAWKLGIVLPIAMAVCPHGPQGSERSRFTSAAAKQAHRTYRKKLREAEQTHLAAREKARGLYVRELKEAMRKALVADDLEEALAIRLEQRKIEQRADNVAEIQRLLRTIAAGKFEERKWKHGDPPLKLVRADEGFCFLSGIGGAYDGHGEGVRVYIKEGDWYLGGTSMQESLWATAMIVRFK